MRGFISRDEVVHDAYDAGVLRTQEDQTPIAEEVIRSHEVAELYCEIYITVASVPPLKQRDRWQGQGAFCCMMQNNRGIEQRTPHLSFISVDNERSCSLLSRGRSTDGSHQSLG